METNRKRFTLSLTLAAVVALGASGRAARAEEVVERKLGVGYKVGNGIGFEGGDLIFRAIPHLSFDLQIGYYGSTDTLTDGSTVAYSGFGLAPAVHAELRPVGHTPYLAAGPVYVRLGARHEGDSGTGTGVGFFANGGYEWRFASGLGVLLGAGVGDLVSMHFSADSASAATTPNHVYFNIEGGVRYFFWARAMAPPFLAAAARSGCRCPVHRATATASSPASDWSFDHRIT